MIDTSVTLASWKATLCKNVDLGELLSRNPTAHKLKAPWRALLLRECVAWRVQDLLEQSMALHGSAHSLGARILLRSAFETVAILVRLNQLIRKVIAGELDFHNFSRQTTELLLGSRDNTTKYNALNITTVLEHADRRFPGLLSWYAALSESAHPNCDGLLNGYSQSDQQNHITTFANQWNRLFSKTHIDGIHACIVVFEAEYNHEWPSAFEALERWVETNDALLESTKLPDLTN